MEYDDAQCAAPFFCAHMLGRGIGQFAFKCNSLKSNTFCFLQRSALNNRTAIMSGMSALKRLVTDEDNDDDRCGVGRSADPRVFARSCN